MCKSEIFAKIINIVSKETEVPVDQILSSDKNMETVDARYLLVSLLSESGMYPSQIAVHIHKTKRAVNYNFLRVCDQMLAMLNPEFAAKQQQEQEISALKGQMSNMDKNMQEMSKNMADLIAQNQKLMEQLGVVEASKNKK